MNIQKSLETIKRYKWMILTVFILTMVVGFFFLRNLPHDYRSEAKLSTGLLDPSRQLAPDNASYTGPDVIIKLNQQFSTIMDIMKMPKNISLLSYRLILHDLKDQKAAFRPWSEELKGLSAQQRTEAIAIFEERLNRKQVLTPLDTGRVRLYQMVTSMGYDEKSIGKKLDISHEQNSDFISVAFTSHNTLLSVFVVNTLSKDFINNYSVEQIGNKNTAIVVLDSLLKKKEAVMNDRIRQLKDYKIRNGVLNLDKQSQIVYQQITDNETRKNQALIDKQAAQAALKSVNEKLASRSNDKYLGAEVLEDNRAIISIKNKIQAAEDVYLRNGYKAADKKTVDSLQQQLSSRLIKSNDQYVSDPLIAKQSLVQRRISLGIEIERATAGINDIDRELAKLNAKFSGMVPFDAGVQDFERNADVATKEYLEILSRYNQTSLDKNIGLRLQLVQEGIPTTPENSKKLIFLALSAIASLAICFCTLFLLSVLDRSINNGAELRSALQAKLIGELGFIDADPNNTTKIWTERQPEGSFAVFRNQLRTLRFELDSLLFKNNHKVLGLTAANSSAGDAFTVINLAYAFAAMGKNVLLIGGQELISTLKKLDIAADQTITAVLQGTSVSETKPFSFVKNDLEGRSLLEIRDRAGLSETFDHLRSRFDLILIDFEPLEEGKGNREWISMVDQYTAIFTAGSTLNEQQKAKLVELNRDEKFAGWMITGVKQP
ncbi:GumC family protein [Pedobacter sp. GSP4]|uniref:GumC family protein n=1 Tax=Pedobacter sp. GSP4 TaxID=3453716 RepID=UPI003EE8CDB0